MTPTRKLWILTATCSFLLLLVPPVMGVAQPAADPAEGDLHALAMLLNRPAIATAVATPAAVDEVNCGTPGECNYMECPMPECEPGTTASCSCEATGHKCGFLTKYPTYDCTCTCYQNDPPSGEECFTVGGTKICPAEDVDAPPG